MGSNTLDPDQHISTIFRMRNVIQDLNIFSLLYLIPHSCNAKVEILNYFGELTLETGVVQGLTCEVTGTEPGLDFVWFIGERHLPSTHPAEEIEEGGLQQRLSYIPQISDDDTDLVCRYGTEQSSLKIKTWSQKILQTSRIHMVDHRTSQIFLLAEVYPPPTVRNALWTVEDLEGKKKTVISGEHKDGLHAEVAEEEDDNIYKFILNIASSKEEIIKSKVTLTLSTGQKISETQFDMQLETQLDANPTETISVKKESIAWWIWLVIVVVILLVLIVFIVIFLRQKRRREEASVTQKTYTSHLGNIYLKPASQDDTYV